MKLLLIRIVAKRVRGLSCSFKMRCEGLSLSSRSRAKSWCDKEKKATSDPEINAELKSSSNTNRKDSQMLAVGIKRSRKKEEEIKTDCRIAGSVSNGYSFI